MLQLAALILALPLVGCADKSAAAQEAPAAAAFAPPGERDEGAKRLDPRAMRIGKHVADVALEFVDGTRGSLAALAGPAGLVVLVRGAECPVSKLYGSESARIEAEYKKRGVGFLFVDMEEPSAPEAVREEIATFGFKGPYALDPGQVLGAELGATRTTEAFLLDSARTLVYRGAIDDQYGRGISRPAPRQRYLCAALEALLSRESVRIEATSAPGCVLPARAPDVGVGTVAPPTYHREISRILQRTCVGCHRQGGEGPFSLENYEAVRRKRATILDVIAQGIMPPWFATPGSGPWEDDKSLATEDRLVLERWFAADAPAGDPADAPVPRQWKDGWQIGEPDYVVSMPETFHVPAEGVVEFQFFYSAPVPEDMWVQRLQLKPSAKKVLHHSLAYLIPPDKIKRLFFGYVPGVSPLVYEEGIARFVPKGSVFEFSQHYTPNGVAVDDRTELGFVLAKSPPEYVAFMRALASQDIFIPAGADNVSQSLTYKVGRRMFLRAFTPHMHLRGKRFLVEALLPDGTSKDLLRLTGWDQGWQFTYRFRDWELPSPGTVLKATAWWDNSAANEDNPDPTVDVRHGAQTTDEMFMLGVEWLVRRGDMSAEGPRGRRRAEREASPPSDLDPDAPEEPDEEPLDE